MQFIEGLRGGGGQLIEVLAEQEHHQESVEQRQPRMRLCAVAGTLIVVDEAATTR